MGILSKRARAEPLAPVCIEDARRLALELAGLEAPNYLDPMRMGLVLEPGEDARRAVGLWLRVQSVANGALPPGLRSS